MFLVLAFLLCCLVGALLGLFVVSGDRWGFFVEVLCGWVCFLEGFVLRLPAWILGSTAF